MPGRNTAFLSQEKYDEMRTAFSRFNEPWLEEEVEELKAMASEGVSKSVMASQLQRTPNSIQMKLKSLGLYVPKPMPPRWSEDDDKSLIEMYQAGDSFEDMSVRFDRSVNAVISRLVHLRVKLFSGD